MDENDLNFKRVKTKDAHPARHGDGLLANGLDTCSTVLMKSVHSRSKGKMHKVLAYESAITDARGGSALWPNQLRKAYKFAEGIKEPAVYLLSSVE